MQGQSTTQGRDPMEVMSPHKGFSPQRIFVGNAGPCFPKASVSWSGWASGHWMPGCGRAWSTERTFLGRGICLEKGTVLFEMSEGRGSGELP